jgi:maltooligosyltrehalose trehalohydrolase
MRENVRHWLEEYHLDGLRFDATHAFVDRSPVHIVHELTAHGRRSVSPRPIYVSAENESQDVSLLRADDTGSGVDGLWNEDWHHSAFVALTGLREAYFTDYLGTAQELASMARSNFLYQGQWYSWQRQPRGSDSSAFPHAAFVCFLENHDQVANTGHGTRLYHVADRAKWRALSTLLLLGPSVPLIFQGQEAAVEQPFTYFADHKAPLSDVVRKGRLEFLSQFPSLAAAEASARLPDPSDESQFTACRLDWRDTAESRETRRLYRDLLSLRRTDPMLAELGTADVRVEASAPTSEIVLVRYTMDGDMRLVLVNLGRLTSLAMNDPLLAPSRGRQWNMLFCSEHADYGGRGVAASFADGRWRLQAHCAWLLQSIPRTTSSRPSQTAAAP